MTLKTQSVEWMTLFINVEINSAPIGPKIESYLSEFYHWGGGGLFKVNPKRTLQTMNDFTWNCRMEKKHFIIQFAICNLSTTLVNSIKNFFIMGLLTFLKKMILNPWITLVVHSSHFLLFTLDVNLSHRNDVFEWMSN